MTCAALCVIIMSLFLSLPEDPTLIDRIQAYGNVIVIHVWANLDIPEFDSGEWVSHTDRVLTLLSHNQGFHVAVYCRHAGLQHKRRQPTVQSANDPKLAHRSHWHCAYCSLFFDCLYNVMSFLSRLARHISWVTRACRSRLPASWRGSPSPRSSRRHS